MRATIRKPSNLLALSVLSIGTTAPLAAQEVTTVFEPVADTYLRRGTPNTSHGGAPVLEIKSAAATNRVLVRFDMAAVAATVGRGSLVSAQLELFVETNGGGWGSNGRPVEVRRSSTAWSEEGATWNCATDTDLSNNRPDCSPRWAGGNVEPAALTTALHTDDLLGPVRFDLTQEVAALLAGAEYLGWSIERGAGAGTVFYASREGTPGRAPRLVVVYEAANPQVRILHPGAQTLTNQTSIEVLGSIESATPIASLYVNGQLTEVVSGVFTAHVALPEGTVFIEVVATNAAGEVGNAVTTVIVDRTPPELEILSPSAGTLVSSDSVRVVGEVLDSSGIESLRVGATPVSVDDKDFEAIAQLDHEGNNVIVVEATDRAGNSASASVVVDRITLLAIDVTSPQEGDAVVGDTLEVSGTVSASAAAVEVDSVPATVTGNNWMASVPIVEGANRLTVVAHLATGQIGLETVTVFRDSTSPRLAVSSPRPESVVDQDQIDVAGTVVDVVGLPGNAAPRVVVEGLEAIVIQGSFLVQDVPLVLGANQLTVLAIDSAGNTTQRMVDVSRREPTGLQLRKIGGDHQSGPVGMPLTEPLTVEVRRDDGDPAEGLTVLFAVDEGNGTLSDSRRQAVVATDSAGRAAMGLRLGTRAGLGNHKVVVSVPDSNARVVFSASAESLEPSNVIVDSGDDQIGLVGRPLPEPLVVLVTDNAFNHLANVPITFRVVQGGGNFAGATDFETTTDANGSARAVLTLGPEEGAANNVVWAFLTEDPESPIAGFSASGRVAGRPEETSIVGTVLDNNDLPVPAAMVTIPGTTLSTETGEDGFFRFAPAPFGAVHLRVDADTTSRPGSWPHLELLLNVIPGRENSLGRPIYVLPLDESHALAVSETEGGVLTLPDFPGFELAVAPGSVTFPDGSKTGEISVTVVHADKIPMPPNGGQQPRFIITIQPAGAVFDPPAAIKMPNVSGMAPGQVTELYSFDHDLRRFVSIGLGEVTEDALSIASMEGYGILEAGWHCGGDPEASGTTYNCQDCQKCVENCCKPDPVKNHQSCKRVGRPNDPDWVCKDGVCVCPKPVNFRPVRHEDLGNGVLRFFYEWDSSTGDLADLQHCTMCESLEFQESPFGPPFPDLEPSTLLCPPNIAVKGMGTDTHTTPGPFVEPYFDRTLATQQTYFFICPCHKKAGDPFARRVTLLEAAITREVRRGPDGQYFFTISKHGVTTRPVPLD